MIPLDSYSTFVVASLVLLLGRKLVASIGFLQTYSIPEPVVGGLVAAILLFGFHGASGMGIRFDNSLSAPLMLAFFASIGLNADLASLRRGGRPLLVFLAVVFGLLVMQNTVGLMLAKALGLDPLIGLLAGSITLSGGHGTGLAWGEVFSEKYGLTSAPELALAGATFGLVLGGLIGGPVARFLVARVTPVEMETGTSAPGVFEMPSADRLITAPALVETLALFSVCLLQGNKSRWR